MRDSDQNYKVLANGQKVPFPESNQSKSLQSGDGVRVDADKTVNLDLEQGNLPQSDGLDDGDKLAVCSGTDGITELATVAQLRTYLETTLSLGGSGGDFDGGPADHGTAEVFDLDGGTP